MNRKRAERTKRILLFCAVIAIAGLAFLFRKEEEPQGGSTDPLAVSFQEDERSLPTSYVYADKMPTYQDEDAVVLNHNRANFTKQDLAEISLGAKEQFEGLDALGRCRGVTALLDASMMPVAEREGIGDVRPSGWHTVKYPELIEDNYLYNRCHLIAFALSGRNADVNNLVTGTRHLNKDLMLPYEIAVINYLERSPRNQVLYRVTPYYYKDELVCRGIEMEAYSVGDNGRDLSYHVFLYNVQPGIEIDYETGSSCTKE